MRGKKITLFFLTIIIGLLFSFYTSFGNSESCEYDNEIYQCQNTINKRGIQDYTCISGEKQAVIYQIILGKEFQKVDEEIETYLNGLETDKNKFFGEDESISYISVVDEIAYYLGKGGVYEKQYIDVCKEIFTKVKNCNGGSIDTNIFNYFHINCKDLGKFKTDIYKNVAYDILYININQVRKDAIKKYQIKQRTKYSELIDMILINLSFMERILAKWNIKLKNVYK